MTDPTRTLTDGRKVLIYPFPLTTGQIAMIELPSDPLSAEDAERIAAFVRTIPIYGSEGSVEVAR